MRPRISVRCVVHAESNGKTLFGRIEWLSRKLRIGIITSQEQDELAGLLAKYRKSEFKPTTSAPKEVIVALNGFGTLRMKFTDYQLRGNGLSIVAKIW